MAKKSKVKKLQKADVKVHKAKHKLHEKEEKLSEKEEHLHKAVEKAEHKKIVSKAMKHKDVLGAGAKKRKKLSPKTKTEVVMKEFKQGTLHSGSGAKVTNPKQAIAIGLSEARKAGGKVKPKSRKKKK